MAFPGGPPRLKVTFKVSDGTNEQKLLKILVMKIINDIVHTPVLYHLCEEIDPSEFTGKRSAVGSTTSATVVRLWARSRPTKLGRQLKFSEAAQLPRTQVRIVHGGHHGGENYKVDVCCMRYIW